MCSGTMTARVGSLPACRGAQLALLAAVLTVLAHAPSACAFHALEQREGLMALCECDASVFAGFVNLRGGACELLPPAQA